MEFPWFRGHLSAGSRTSRSGGPRGIGMLEVLAAGGLILPAAFEIAPALTPLAACGVYS